MAQSTTSFTGISNAVRGDESFLNRVSVAIVNAALDITNEVSSTPNYNKRQTLVPKVTNDPDSWQLQFAIAIALQQNLTSTSGTTDAQLYNGAQAVWNAMAGMV